MHVEMLDGRGSGGNHGNAARTADPAVFAAGRGILDYRSRTVSLKVLKLLDGRARGRSAVTAFFLRVASGLVTLMLLAAGLRAQDASPPLAPPPQPPPGNAAASPEAAPRPAVPARSTVFAVRDATVVERYSVSPPRVRMMVDRLVAAATGQPDAGHAWRSLVSPADVVGIKIAASRGAAAPSRRAVVAAVVEGLIAAGHPRDRIVVWDRDADELRLAGFLPERGSSESVFPCPVTGIEPRTGYDSKAVYTVPALGKLIWGDLSFQGQSPLAAAIAAQKAGTSAADTPTPTPGNGPPGSKGNKRAPAALPENLSDASHLCFVLTKRVTKVINLPAMSDSTFAGIGGALYNMTIPNVDNWRRLVGEPRWGNPYIVDLYADQRIGGRVVLNIMDGLIAQYAGGPGFPAALRPPSRHDLREQGSRGARCRRAPLPGALARPARSAGAGPIRQPRAGRRRIRAGQLRRREDRPARRRDVSPGAFQLPPSRRKNSAAP